MVSVGDSQQLGPIQTLYPPLSPSSSLSKSQRSQGRSMRTIRSNFYENHERSCSFTTVQSSFSEVLTDSVIDFRLAELAEDQHNLRTSSKNSSEIDFLDLSQAFSDFSACSSDISGELQRLSCLPPDLNDGDNVAKLEHETWLALLKKENLNSEIFEECSEVLQSAVRVCVQGLDSPSVDVKRSAAAKLRLLGKNNAENRALIGASGGIPGLILLLKCIDPWTQEHAVTALFNLSLHEENKNLITNAGAIKPLVYVLKTGTEVSKQNSACALLSLCMVEDNKISIGVCGAIPPLVSLLLHGSNRGKKDALTTLYKLCSVKQNKERALKARVVKPLVELVSEQGNGLAEKAMVVLSSLAGIQEGKVAIVEEGGIPVLVEAIEDGSVKGKEFAVLTLLQLCKDSVRNRGLLVKEGGIPPLVSLSQSGTTRAKNKAETLLKYLREPREDPSSSTPSIRGNRGDDNLDGNVNLP